MLRRVKATSKCSPRPSQSWRPPASVAVTITSETPDAMQANKRQCLVRDQQAAS